MPLNDRKVIQIILAERILQKKGVPGIEKCSQRLLQTSSLWSDSIRYRQRTFSNR